MKRDDPKFQQINMVLPKAQVRWLDKQAGDLGLTRTKVMTMLLDGLIQTEKAANKPETLFNLYSNHIEYILDETTKKKKKTKKK